MPAPPASSRQAPNDSISCPARIDPIHAPRLLPTPISGNRRLPCSSVKRSAANAQNCAITITLKMPSQTKNTMPMRSPAASASRNSSRFDAKNSVTRWTSCTRFTRDANAPYAGTIASSSTACPADE